MLPRHAPVFLVVGEDTKHTSMFDWMTPAGFATDLRAGGNPSTNASGTSVKRRSVRPWGTYLFIPPCMQHNITNVGEKPVRVLITSLRPSAPRPGPIEDNP